MPSKEELDRALKAFKKRLKVTRRDAESSSTRGALTGGKDSGIVGVPLPEGFPLAVWEELIAQGRIRRTPGERTYELVPPKSP